MFTSYTNKLYTAKDLKVLQVVLTCKINNRRSKLTIQIVNSEQEFDFIIRSLPAEAVHGRDELVMRNTAGIILVEDLEHALREERLRKHNRTIINKR